MHPKTLTPTLYYGLRGIKIMGFRSIKTKQITDIRVRLPIRGGFSLFSFLFGAHMYISCVLGVAFFGSLIYLLLFCLSKKKKKPDIRVRFYKVKMFKPNFVY